MIIMIINGAFYALNYAYDTAEAMRLNVITDSDDAKEDNYLEVLEALEFVEAAWDTAKALAPSSGNPRTVALISFYDSAVTIQINAAKENILKFWQDVETGTTNQQRGHLTHVLNNSGNQLRNLRNLRQYL